MKKIIVYLTTIMIVVGGITTANAQSARSNPPTQPGIQLVQKKTLRHILNGHQGVKERRKGYRRHSDGYWYPPAAFAEVPSGKDKKRDRKSVPRPDQR